MLGVCKMFNEFIFGISYRYIRGSASNKPGPVLVNRVALTSKLGLSFVMFAVNTTALIYSSVGIALGYGMDDRGSRVRFPAETGNFSLHHRLRNGSGAHPASYPMGTRGSFLGGKVARA
jgi:hypothetical protein